MDLPSGAPFACCSCCGACFCVRGLHSPVISNRILGDSAHINGSIFAGFDTLIGPVYLAAGFGEGGHSNYYLFFGAPPQ